MQIKVMNRMQAEEYARGAHTDTSVIISIRSEDIRKAFIPCIPNINGIKDTKYLEFNDTDKNDSMSYKQALEIRDFVLKHKDKVDTIIVQCEAGKSRSAGTAAAIMKYMFNDDSAIFDNPMYIPNMLCYRQVLTAFIENEY